MLPIPADVFTEPEDVSPDGLANLGPLRRPAGVWQADKGIDINPKAARPEQRTFIERQGECTWRWISSLSPARRFA